jgi:hypothetical protein
MFFVNENIPLLPNNKVRDWPPQNEKILYSHRHLNTRHSEGATRIWLGDERNYFPPCRSNPKRPKNL